MKLVILFYTLLIPILAFADNSNQWQDKTLIDIEARSLAMRVDVSSHINGIQEKVGALKEIRNPDVRYDTYFQLLKENMDRTYQLLESVHKLKYDATLFMKNAGLDYLALHSQDGNGVNSLHRIMSTKREILCSEFALTLLSDSNDQFEKISSLANFVLSECKKINNTTPKINDTK